MEHFFLSNDGTKHTVCYNIVTGTVDCDVERLRRPTVSGISSTSAEISA